MDEILFRNEVIFGVYNRHKFFKKGKNYQIDSQKYRRMIKTLCFISGL